MAMDYNKVSLDTQEQLMENAKAKARAFQDKRLLEEQEEQIRNLLLLNNLQDTRNQREEMKPKKDYEHSEDNLPSGEDLMALSNDPEAVKALSAKYRENLDKASKKDLPSIAMESKEGKDLLSPEDKQKLAEAAAIDMGDYIPGTPGSGRKLFAELTMKDYKPSETPDAVTEAGNAGAAAALIKDKPINPSGVVAYQSDNPFVPDPEFHGGENPRKDQTIDKYKADVFSKPEEVNEENWHLEQYTPRIDEALKAIADKDPNLLQLPEVQALIKRSQAGYDKQRALATVAAFTSNPQMWMDQANKFREEGDRNLMDAADNLEKLRQRQLDATKAVADNLTTQKSTLAGVHNSVLNLEGSLAQVAVPTFQQAYDLDIQANTIHEKGDAAIGSAIQKMQAFVQRLGKSGLNAAQAEALQKEADALTASNIRQFISKVNLMDLNAPMRKVFEERVDTIAGEIAQYDAAMAQSRQMKQQAATLYNKGMSMLSSASNLGGKYRIPEWMKELPKQAPTQDAPTEQVPLQDPSKQGGTKDPVIPVQEDKQPGTPPPPPPPPPKPIKFDPWSYNTFNLPADKLKANINALARAYSQRGSKGAGTRVAFYTGFEGDDPGARQEIVVKGSEENMKALLDNLSRLRSSNGRKYNDVMNGLDPTTLGAIETAGEKSHPTISTDAYSIKNGKRLGKFSMGDDALKNQDAMIAQLFADSGYAFV